MFPDFYQGPIYLSAWVQLGSITFQAAIVDADHESQTAQVIQLGTLFEQSVSYRDIASVALVQGHRVLQSFGRPRATVAPEWVRYAQVAQ